VTVCNKLRISDLYLQLVSLIATTAFTSISPQHAYADANCDKAGSAVNDGGQNFRGNIKQCGPLDIPKEPIRNCKSPQQSKDNDGDGDIGCKSRGN